MHICRSGDDTTNLLNFYVDICFQQGHSETVWEPGQAGQVVGYQFIRLQPGLHDLAVHISNKHAYNTIPAINRCLR